MSEPSSGLRCDPKALLGHSLCIFPHSSLSRNPHAPQLKPPNGPLFTATGSGRGCPRAPEANESPPLVQTMSSS